MPKRQTARGNRTAGRRDIGPGSARRSAHDGYGFEHLDLRPRPYGLVLPSVVRAWHVETLRWLDRVPGAELVVAMQEPGRPSRWPRHARRNSLRAVETGEAVHGVPVAQVAVDGLADTVGAAWGGLDFVLTLGERLPPPGLIDVPRYGTWQLVPHSDDVPLGFWEILRGESVAHAALVRLHRDGRPRSVLREGWFRIASHSLGATAGSIRSHMAVFPALAVRDLAHGIGPGPAAPGLTSGLAAPSAVERIRVGVATLAAATRRASFALVRRERWNVGVFEGDVGSFLDAGGARGGVRWLPESSNTEFIADPFPIPGTDTIMVERWSHDAGRGSVAAVDHSGTPVPVGGFPSGEDRHFSYPFVFGDGPSVYCMPEAAEGRELRLLELVAAPAGWQQVGVLIPGVAALDGTVFRHEGRWWLACCDWAVDPRGQLFLWHAPELHGPWHPHNRNPVKIDPRSSRPAGTPLTINGVLHRPAQDCSRSYGARVSLQRITRLTPDEYAEEEVASVTPDPAGPYPDGLHTLSTDGRITLIDGKRHQFALTALAGHLRRAKRARRFGF